MGLLLIVVILLTVRWFNTQFPASPVSSTDGLHQVPGETRSGTSDSEEYRSDSRMPRSSTKLPDETEPQLPDIVPDGESNSRPVDSESTSRSDNAPQLERFRKKVDSRGPPDGGEVAGDQGNVEKPHPDSKHSVASESDEARYKIENQTIRDLNGMVVFQGTIDLKPTLDRIERGGSNRHRNDGTTFQNREGRLPRKPSGYYKEYVHPTPNERGPGPQRVIVGREGDIWYTPDHYKTFKRLKVGKLATPGQ